MKMRQLKRRALARKREKNNPGRCPRCKGENDRRPARGGRIHDAKPVRGVRRLSQRQNVFVLDNRPR